MWTRRCMALMLGVWMMVFIVAAAPRPVQGQTVTDAQPVVTIKIRDIDRMLQDLESLMPANTGANPSSQMAMIKGLLQGHGLDRS